MEVITFRELSTWSVGLSAWELVARELVARVKQNVLAVVELERWLLTEVSALLSELVASATFLKISFMKIFVGLETLSECGSLTDVNFIREISLELSGRLEVTCILCNDSTCIFSDDNWLFNSVSDNRSFSEFWNNWLSGLFYNLSFVTLVNDRDVLFVNDLFLGFMNNWNVLLSNVLFMDHWLDVFGDNVLVVLVDHILVFLFDNVFVMFVNNISVLLSDEWGLLNLFNNGLIWVG